MYQLKEMSSSDVEELSNTFVDFDSELVKYIIYFDGWSGWEENAGIFIFQGIDDCYYVVDYGYCVMSEDNTNYFILQEITKDQIMELINDMNQAIENSERLY